MVLWSKDYLTAKLDEAGRLTADSATQESSSTFLFNLVNKPDDWLDKLTNDPCFTNPHQLEAVAVSLGIKSSMAASVETLQTWETVECLQDLEREALIRQQINHQQFR
jgi:hypothetical protein